MQSLSLEVSEELDAYQERHSGQETPPAQTPRDGPKWHTGTHPPRGSSVLRSSSENMLQRVVPSAIANLSAATIEGVLSVLSMAPT